MCVCVHAQVTLLLWCLHRLNKEPPNIYFKKKDKGGINLNTMVRRTCPSDCVRMYLYRQCVNSSWSLYTCVNSSWSLYPCVNSSWSLHTCVRSSWSLHTCVRSSWSLDTGVRSSWSLYICVRSSWSLYTCVNFIVYAIHCT